jgi:hypothetical protein
MSEPVTTMRKTPPAITDTKDPDLREWRDSAFTAAMEKFHHNHDNIEAILQTGEAFGRAVHSAHLNRTREWPLDEWCTEVSHLLAPLGDSFAITGARHDVVATFLRRNPLASHPHDVSLDALFTYATLRGLFRSAFPGGEVVLDEGTPEHPGALFFKLHPSSLDRLTRERVKDTITVMYRHDSP